MQLRWAGHLTRMEDLHMPKAVFFSELQGGKRGRGAPRKRYKNQLKRQLAQAGISHQSWQQEASDRDSWRSSMRKASCEFEADIKPQKKKAGGRKSEQHLYHPHPKPSSVQSAVRVCIKNRSLQPPQSLQKLTTNLPNNSRLRGMNHHHME